MFVYKWLFDIIDLLNSYLLWSLSFGLRLCLRNIPCLIVSFCTLPTHQLAMFSLQSSQLSWHQPCPECQLGNSFPAACKTVSEWAFSLGWLEIEALCPAISVWHFWQKRGWELVFTRLFLKKSKQFFLLLAVQRGKLPSQWETKSHSLKIPMRWKHGNEVIHPGLAGSLWLLGHSCWEHRLHCNPCFPGR